VEGEEGEWVEIVAEEVMGEASAEGEMEEEVADTLEEEMTAEEE
jgi:hypothetical protein